MSCSRHTGRGGQAGATNSNMAAPVLYTLKRPVIQMLMASCGILFNMPVVRSFLFLGALAASRGYWTWAKAACLVLKRWQVEETGRLVPPQSLGGLATRLTSCIFSPPVFVFLRTRGKTCEPCGVSCPGGSGQGRRVGAGVFQVWVLCCLLERNLPEDPLPEQPTTCKKVSNIFQACSGFKPYEQRCEAQPQQCWIVLGLSSGPGPWELVPGPACTSSPSSSPAPGPMPNG